MVPKWPKGAGKGNRQPKDVLGAFLHDIPVVANVSGGAADQLCLGSRFEYGHEGKVKPPIGGLQIDGSPHTAIHMPDQGLTRAFLALALRAASPSNSAFLRNCGKALAGRGAEPRFRQMASTKLALSTACAGPPGSRRFSRGGAPGGRPCALNTAPLVFIAPSWVRIARAAHDRIVSMAAVGQERIHSGSYGDILRKSSQKIMI